MKALLPTLLLLAPLAALAGERVDDIVRDQREHGYRSAAAAIERLEAADDRPGPTAPLAQRERYHTAIATLAVSSRQPAMVAAADRALSALDTMARAENCRPCAVNAALVRAQDALTRRDPDEAERLLSEVETALPASSSEVSQNFHDARARLYNIRGNF